MRTKRPVRLILTSVLTLGLLPAAAGVPNPGPGETSGAPLAPLIVTDFDRNTGLLDLSYQTGCASQDNNVYSGPLDQVVGMAWTDEVCGIGTGGVLGGYDAGAGSRFFVIVGNDGRREGSYGAGSPGVERAAFAANACDVTQDLAAACSPAPTGGACVSSFNCAARETCLANPAAGGQCACLDPFAGDFCESCAPGFSGPDCRECAPGFFSNALVAATGTDLPEDLRDPRHLRCEPDVVESCVDVRCSGTGACVIVERDAVCACDEGYAGADCSHCAPDYEDTGSGCELDETCRTAKCGGNGDCRATPFGDVTCECDAGFSGADCGGPPLVIRTTSETKTLYDGETILLEPDGLVGPPTWRLVEGPARLVTCTGTNCPAGFAELTVVAPPGGLDDLQLIQVAVFDGAGNQATDNFAALPPTVVPFTGEIHGELLPFYRAMLKFMRARGVRGGTLAISKGGKVVGANGYGYRDAGLDADPFVNAGEGGPLVQPDSPFRVASVSKTLTAAAVRQTAVDMGVSIFSSSQPNRAATWVQASTGFSLTGGAPPFAYDLPPLTTDSRWANVTIAHLMNHHAGFLRDSIKPSTTGQPAYNASMLPFTEAFGDPTMLQPAQTGASSRDISYATMYAVAALQLTANPRPTVENMIRFMAGTSLGYNPGGSAGGGDNYSNMGYILLGRVLEGLLGEDYDPDEPGVPSGWGAFPTLLQDYLCQTSGITSGILPGKTRVLDPLEPYYRDLDWQGNESREWNLAEGADKIRFNAGIQQWQFCQSGCPDDPGAVWNDDPNTPSPFGGIWLAERNSAGGIAATAPALLKFARNHRIKVGSPNDGSSGIGSLLPTPGTHASSSSHNGSLPGTRSLLWQMAGTRTNRLPFPSFAWNPDPTAPLDLDGMGRVLINEGTVGTSCTLPSDVVVAVMFNQRQDQRAPNSNVSPQSTGSNSSAYNRINDFLAAAACEVDGDGWPAISDPPPVLIAQPPCN